MSKAGNNLYNLFLLTLMTIIGVGCVVSITRLAFVRKSNKIGETGVYLFLATVTVLITVAFYTLILPEFRPYPYADDWIYTEPLKFTSFTEWLKFTFAQHVDHRIPIQKLFGFALLWMFNFDFRYFVGLNFLLGLGIVAMLLYIIRACRSYLTLGDVIVPLIVLHFGVGYSLWGFQFQFVSSVFFYCLFLTALTRFAVTENRSYIVLASLALLAVALCGINGLLFATVGTIGALAWLFYNGSSKYRSHPMLVIVLLIEGGLWLSWHPTAATNVGGFEITTFMTYFQGLLPSSLVVFSFQGAWKAAIVAGLLICALLSIVFKLLGRRFTRLDLITLLGLVASCVVIASVAYGRAKAQGAWNPVLGMHYGFLTVFIPIISWLILSMRLESRAVVLLGTGLALFSMAAFKANFEWRAKHIDQTQAHQQKVLQALQAGEDPSNITSRFLKDFTLEGDQRLFDEVVAGIRELRAAHAPLYGPTGMRQP